MDITALLSTAKTNGPKATQREIRAFGKMVTHWVCKRGRPLKCLDDPELKTIVQFLSGGRLEMPGRALRCDALTELASDARQKVQAFTTANAHCSVQADCWSEDAIAVFAIILTTITASCPGLWGCFMIWCIPMTPRPAFGPSCVCCDPVWGHKPHR